MVDSSSERPCRLVNVANDVGHADLEAEEGSEVRGLGGVIAGKLLALAASALGALLGEEPKMAAAGICERIGFVEWRRES